MCENSRKESLGRVLIEAWRWLSGQRVSCKVYRATIKARHAVCIYNPRDPKETWEVVAEKSKAVPLTASFARLGANKAYCLALYQEQGEERYPTLFSD